MPCCAHWVAAVFIFLSAALNGSAGAQDLEAPQEGAKIGRKSAKEGKVRITLDWKEVLLRERLMAFGKKYNVPIFLDRRVDPDQKIELSARDMPVEEVPSLVAENLNLGRAILGKMHYIGPKASAGQLAPLVARRKSELSQLPASSRAVWNKSKVLKWDEAAMPREIVTSLMAEAGMTLDNPEQIPHDIWPAYELPAMPLADRLSLVLIGFDLTWRMSPSGSTLRVQPVPQDLRLAGPNGLPDEIAEPLRTGQTKTVTKGAIKQTFSLTVHKQPAGAVLGTVARKLGKELKYDPSLRDKLREDVTFAVKDVSLEELLAKTLTPLGLSGKVTEKTLEVISLP